MMAVGEAAELRSTSEEIFLRRAAACTLNGFTHIAALAPALPEGPSRFTGLRAPVSADGMVVSKSHSHQVMLWLAEANPSSVPHDQENLTLFTNAVAVKAGERHTTRLVLPPETLAEH